MSHTLIPAMRLFITGAAGFIGRSLVTQSLTRGHRVVALVRGTTDVTTLPWASDPRVTIVRGDLRERSDWVDALRGSDAVIHGAYGQGDFFSQFAGTVVGTENLLAGMEAVGVRRLVHLSTFSLYDYRALPARASLDETAPLETHPQLRDAYTQTKLVQEQLVRDFARRGGQVTVVRPGAVYGAGKMWDAGMSMRVTDGWWLAIAPWAALKLTYVENCAHAIVLTAENPAAVGETFNIVDTDPPTQRAYAKALRRHGIDVPRSIPVPYVVARAVAQVADAVNRAFFRHRARLPWVLSPAKLDASCKPLTYPNERARWTLGWTPQASLDEALDAITRGIPVAPMHMRLGQPDASTPTRAKRLIKVGVSLAVHGYDRAAGLVGRPLASRSRGVIVLYHDIAPSRLRSFHRQLDRLQHFARPSTLAELRGEPDGTWRVAVTFDDAWRSFGDHAVGELQRRGIPVALFVPSALLVESDHDQSRELMTVAELRALPAAVEIGSHGRTHVRLTRLDDPALTNELSGSRDELERVIGRAVTAHAFPYGEWSPRVAGAARDAGFTHLYGIEPDIARAEEKPVIPRVVVDPVDWPIESYLKLRGAYRWMAPVIEARNRRRPSAPSHGAPGDVRHPER